MEALLSNSTRKLLWFEISKMLTAVLKNLLSSHTRTATVVRECCKGDCESLWETGEIWPPRQPAKNTLTDGHPKGTSLHGIASFDVFCIKIGARI